MESFALGMKGLLESGLQDEKTKLQSTIDILENRLEVAKKVCNASSTTAKKCTWELTYDYFDHLEVSTEEELEDQLNLARTKLNNLNSKIHKKTCSHRHPCLCSQDHSSEVQVLAMTNKERLDKMAEFKQLGNSFYSKKQYQDAMKQYQLALIYYEYCFDAVNDEKREIENVRLLSLLNAAACALKLESYQQCVEFCNEAIGIDDNSPKVYFRRGKAERLLDNYASAELDLERAIGLTSDAEMCKDIRHEIKLLQQSKKEYERATQKFAQKAMDCSTES